MKLYTAEQLASRIKVEEKKFDIDVGTRDYKDSVAALTIQKVVIDPSNKKRQR